MSVGSWRQLLVLAALVTAAFVLWLRPSGPGPAGTDGVASNEARADAAAGAVVVLADVRLDQLSAAAPPVPAPARDPFRFRQAAAPPPTPLSPPPARFDEPPPAFTGPEAPQVPPIPLRYMGWFESPRPGEGLVGIFTPTPTGQGMPFYGRAGDVIEGRYRVLRVTQDSADLAYLDGRGRQTIQISGQ